MSRQLLIKSQTAAWYMTRSANYLLNSGVLDGSSWTAVTMTLAGGATDPDAGTSAYTATATDNNATLLQTVDLGSSNINRVFSIYITRKTGTGDISITADGSTYSVETITGSWARYDVDAVATGSVSVGLKIATSGDEVYIAFAQYEDGLTATTYSAVTTSRYTVTQIVDADYPANTARGCVYMDGFFFVMTTEGRVYQSDIADASSWDPIDFIQSQNDASGGVYITKSRNYIVTLKEWATEFFYNAGLATGAVIAPVQNMALQIGCAHGGSVQEINGAIVFMSQTRLGFGRKITSLDTSNNAVISTPSVEKILDEDDLAEVQSWSASIGSHVLYGITLVTSAVSLVYDFTTQQWSYFTVLSDASNSKTITAITAAGVATSTAHGLSDGDIVKVSSTNSDFNGWHVVTDVTTDTFALQATGTAFSGTGTAAEYTETYFPVVSSVRSGGRQYMQDRSSGDLYEFVQDAYADTVGATASRIRTNKVDLDSANPKFMSVAELIGDKIDSTALFRWTDDDYATYSTFKSVDLSATRSRIRRLGNFNRRSFEVLHVGNALFRLEAIEVN